VADEDGLSWLFELDGDVSGAKQLLSVLGNLDSTLKKLDVGMAKLAHGSQAAGEAHRGHGKEVVKVTGFMKAMEAAFKPLEEHFKRVGEFELFRRATDVLIDLPFRLAEGVKDLGEEMLITAAKAERTNKAFELVFGAEIGTETLDYIERIGKYTEFTREQLKGAALDLAKVGFKGEGLNRALAASLDISAFSKSGNEGQGEALGALERIKNSGRVDRRTLRPLGIGEGDFFKELSIRTGKGAKELKKEMEKGTLDADQSLETLYTMITKRTHKDLGGAGVEMGNTLMARLAHLKEVPELLFEKLADLPAFGKISDLIGRAAEALNPAGGVGSKLFDALASAFTRVGNAVTAVDWPGVANNIAKIIDVIGTFVAGGIAFADQMIRGFGRVVDIFTGTPGALGDALTSIGDNILAANKWLGDAMVNLGASLWHGLVDGIKGGVDAVANAAGDLAGGVLEKFKNMLGIHSPSVVFRGLGEMSGEGYAQGLEAKADRAARATADSYGSPQVGRIGGGGSMHNEVNVTVQINGRDGDGASLAEEIATRLRALLPSELQSAFEQIAGEAGT